MSIFAGMADAAQGVINAVMGDMHTYRPVRGTAYKISGVFDSAAVVIEAGGDVPVETRKPVLSIALADLRAGNRAMPEQGDVVTIKTPDQPAGMAYEVREVQPDGWGEVKLVLMRQGAESDA